MKLLQTVSYWLMLTVGIMSGASYTYAGGISLASSCNPLAVETCGLPFPNDLFRNGSGTYNFSDYILDKRTSGYVRTLLPARKQFPDSFLPRKIFNNSSGFSALGPVLFELNDWPINDIPESGEGYLHVYNMETGDRVPMVVSLSRVAQDTNHVREPRPVIIAWPRTRFNFGERYVAVLFKSGLNNTSYSNGMELFTPSGGVEKAVNLEAGWLLNIAYSPVLKVMDSLGIPSDDILSFTWFTVRDQQEVIEPMQKMVNTALNMPNYVAELAPREALGDSEYGLATLTGQMSMVNFRTDDGGVYPPYEPVNDISRRRVEFILTLPKWDKNTAVPVAVSGHGLANFKELTRSVYRMDDRLGIASLAIDHPNHGSRVSLYDEFKEPHISTSVTSPLTIMHLLGMFVQGTIDHNVAINTAKHILPNALASWQHPEIDNLPELDSERVIYDGLSLGAMLGVAIGATAPDLQGAYLVNGAGSLMQVFSESTFWPLTSNVIPSNMNGAEATFVLAMMQHYLDIADGNNFAHLYRDLPEGFASRSLGMHYSLGDGSMTNAASLATAELADLPLLKAVIEPVPPLRYGISGLNDFEDGFGLVQSGFGNQQANQVLGSLEALDSDNLLETPSLSNLQSLLELDVEEIVQQDNPLSAYQNILGVDNFNDVTSVANVVYNGDMEDFLTHFNRNGEAARHRAIDWRCQVLDLDENRCAIAKQIASEEAAEEDDLDTIIGDSEDNPINEISDAIEDGLSDVSVNDGSGGSIDLEFLILWLVALLPMLAFNGIRGGRL